MDFSIRSTDGRAWSAALTRAFPGTQVTPAPGFEAALFRSTQLGAGSLNEVEAGAHRVEHRPPGPPLRLLSVMVQLEGRVGIDAGGREVELGPGQLLLADIDQPLRLSASAPYRQAFVLLPSALVGALPEGGVFRGDGATDRLLIDHVRTLLVVAPTLDERGRRLATEAIVPLVRLVMPHAIPRGARVARALSYMDEHLGDPDLSARTIAAAQGVSRRLLDERFRAAGTTVDRALWTRRLERAAALLRDPSRRADTVLAIALDCGFKDASHFTRAFRAAYGTTPSRFRPG